MTATDSSTIRPKLTVLLPEGWVRIATGEGRDAVIRQVASRAVVGVEPQRRDMARVRVRNMLDDTLKSATDRGLFEVWLPIAPTSGYSIPASFAVGPLPQSPAAGATVQDVLLGLSAATPGAQAVEIAGVVAVRTVADKSAVIGSTGELEAPPVRLVSYIVSPSEAYPDWTVFTASLFVPEGRESAAIVEALEILADSLMATVRIEKAETA